LLARCAPDIGFPASLAIQCVSLSGAVVDAACLFWIRRQLNQKMIQLEEDHE
jgi:hypothetical protein